LSDTIAAIGTPEGRGGIGIIRLSGPDSVKVAGRLFVPNGKKQVAKLNNYSLTPGLIVDPKTKEPVDRVLLSVMRGPHSYTGEDVCEINCHGGMYLLGRVLSLCLENGSRPAQPGEFTKRAFLNGKIDLTQAEGIVDLISAGAKAAAMTAMSCAEGHMGQKIKKIREELLLLLSFILAEIEYPEETDLTELPGKKVFSELLEAHEKLQKLYDTYERGRIIKEGITTVIAGRPNVGKSSLLNLLAGYEKAIVTDIPGTTRDVITEQVQIGSVMLNISDTAGIRDSEDRIEKIGVERTLALLDRCELVLYVLDASQPLTKDDQKLLEQIYDKKVILLINKTDLEQKLDISYYKPKFKQIVYMSAATGEGYDGLAQKIEELFALTPRDMQSGEIISNLRQKACIFRGMEALSRAMEGLDSGFGPDIVSIDIQDAIDALGEMTGQKASEDMIGEIFSRFCLGK
jgi:tRNA modification GTPase